MEHESHRTLTSQVLQVVDRFDAAWQSVAHGAKPPRLEEVLNTLPASDQAAYLRDLLAIELECRMRLGAKPTADEYRSRFPEHAELIEAVMREASQRKRSSFTARLNCPHCHNPIALVVESVAADVFCPSCGSTVHLDTGRSLTWDKKRLPKIAHFDLLEAVGRGAFGTVYKARDEQLHRIVAIKIPRSGVLETDEDEDRFVREARNVAQLQHPGIVTIYSVGRSDTFPYLVSEFVDGVTLAQYLTAKRFSMRDSVQLIRDVAAALHHAHEHGVIHRDLKPSNIMLTPDNAPRLMDFGLAKRDAGEITMTLDGMVLGTPAYMSPEQARGHAHQADARSDIYSLGALFFQLLTNELPFRGEVRMLLHQVLHDEPPSPRKLNSQIPRDLDTICLKCLAKEPKWRYATAGELADDLQRYLDGHPIFARPVSRAERVLRWCRRNPAAASAIAAIFVGLVTTTILSAALWQTNTQLKAAALAERNATTKAENSALAANAHATVAREQSQLALKSLQSVIFDIQRKLKNVPGAGDLRRSLLHTALARLQEVSDQFASRGAIDRNTHIALIDLGDVFLRIGNSSSPCPGTGRGVGSEGPLADAEGPLAAARKLYQQAFDIAQKLAAADQTDARALRDLSISYNRLGNLSLQAGQVTEALGHYQKLLEISQKRVATDPTDAKAQRDLFISYERLGNVSLQAGQVTEALGHCQKGLEISQKLAAADPTDAEAQRDLCISYERLGDVSLQAGQAAEALGHYQKELEISQKLAAADPTDAEAQRDLLVSYSKLGDVSLEAGQVTEALGHYRKFLEISQKLAAADPTDAQAQRDLSISYEKLGDVSLKAGQVTEALGHYQKALEISQKLAAADPTDAQAQFDLYGSYYRIAAVQQEQKQYEQAIELYGCGLKVLQSLKEQMRLAPANEEWIGIVEQAIQECKHAPTALGEWRILLEQSADVLPRFLDFRGQQFVQDGRTADAVQAVAKLRELETATADQLYNAACVYCLCAAGIKPEKDELTAEQAAQSQKHIADALATLKQAIAAGYKDFAHLQKDPDLTPLRDLPEFKSLFPKSNLDESNRP